MRRYAVALALASLVLAAVSVRLDAQGFGSNRYSVTVIVNAPNATIFLDNQPIKGNVANVRRGAHTVRVVAPGFTDFVQSLNVIAHVTVNAQLNPSGFPLTVNSNVNDAVVFVDGRQIAGNVVTVAPGNHAVRVAAEGYRDFNTSVNVNGPAVINAPLVQLPGFPLTVNSNVNDAVVFVDGRQIAGNAANVRAGNHFIRVTAYGYQDFNAEVNVRGPTVINAPLISAGFPLTVTSSIPGAAVFINNVPKGPAPLTEVLPAGTYSILVAASGFGNYQTSVTLSGPMTVSAQLHSAMVTLRFVFPKSFQEPDDRDNDQVKIFVDGAPVSPVSHRRGSGGIQVAPGRHRIDVSSGDFHAQAGDFDFAPGQDYTIELVMELRVRATPR